MYTLLWMFKNGDFQKPGLFYKHCFYNEYFKKTYVTVTTTEDFLPGMTIYVHTWDRRSVSGHCRQVIIDFRQFCHGYF
jgi:hypothetical protein